jgi:hypothetical protein
VSQGDAGQGAAPLDPSLDPATLDYLLDELARRERLQHEKVVALARRLRPDLTPDDLMNPHDFPELNDPDWHYADGELAGLQSIVALLRRVRRNKDSGP